MSSIAPQPTDTPRLPRRQGTMRSFRWEPQHGDEISACPDCAHWHVMFELEGDDYGGTLYVREWHESDCSCWETD